MKRILSVLLICALLVAGLAVVASAAPASITIDAQKTDDVVTAQIKLNGYEADSWSAMTTLVTYNSNALTFSNAESVMEGMQVDSTAAGKLLLCWIADPLTVPADGVVATLTFAVKTVTEEEPIGLKVAFYPDGMALAGETTTMGNAGEENYSTAEAKPSESIVIRPEGSEEPDQPADPEESTNPTIITSTTAPNNKVSFGVKAEYTPGGKTHTYKVNISWTDLTYEFNADEKWNTMDHKWDVVTDGAYWTEADPAEITVVNHSSQPVTATATYIPTVAGTDFTFGATNGAKIDACLEGTSQDQAPKNVITATFNPTAAAVINQNDTPLGTIKVTIA